MSNQAYKLPQTKSGNLVRLFAQSSRLFGFRGPIPSSGSHSIQLINCFIQILITYLFFVHCLKLDLFLFSPNLIEVNLEKFWFWNLHRRQSIYCQYTTLDLLDLQIDLLFMAIISLVMLSVPKVERVYLNTANVRLSV